jgi:GH24 family phage-related lysozyme (muramidase)
MTPKARRLSAAAAIATAIAIPAEGLRQYAYLDPVQVPTVCFGATRGVKLGDHYSVGQCRAMLDAEMLATVEQVERCVPGLPVNVLAAFADAAYNLGPAIACDTEKSTAARLLKAGQIEAACRQLQRWDRARVAGVFVPLPGLTKRRAAEMRLCLTGAA